MVITASSRIVLFMPDDAISAYDEAWNAPDGDARIALLRRCMTSDAELVDPRAGRMTGHDAINEHIAGFAERFPGARVSISSDVDEHHGFARYAWTITDGAGDQLMTGIDVVERADDGRLKRVVMFFGELTTST